MPLAVVPVSDDGTLKLQISIYSTHPFVCPMPTASEVELSSLLLYRGQSLSVNSFQLLQVAIDLEVQKNAFILWHWRDVLQERVDA